MKDDTVFYLLLLLLAIGAVWCFLKNQRPESYTPVLEELPTTPEVELIQGYPDMAVVDEASGMELIAPNDIAMNPGFGVGEGLFGFGRYGLSMLA